MHEESAMNTVNHFVDRYADAQPGKTFLVAPEINRSMSYAALREHARSIAAHLDALGVARGEKVAFLLPNGYWTCALFVGVMYSGRVVVPLNAVSGDAALSYVIEHSDCRALFVDDSYAGKLARVLDDRPEAVQLIHTSVNTGPEWPDGTLAPADPLPPDEETDALLIYTSGTTGRPKGVLLNHRNAVAGGRNTMLAHQLGETDRALCVLPLYHINAEMVTVMGPLVSGGSVVMPQRFSTSAFWQTAARYACTWFSVVPTIIAYLLEHAEREGFDRDALGGLPYLRFGRSASAPLAPEMHRAFEERFGIPIVETMGLTETAAQILSNPMPPARPKYGSPGVAVGNEAKIIDEHGNECPPNCPGELVIRGDNVTRGYYKNPEATAEAIEPDGWLHTGDVAVKDPDGFFFITGRIKELIIKGGENIAPREIDEVLYEHPAVLEAAGFGMPDTMYGQEVMACVALKPGVSCSERELTELTQARLGAFKSPKRVFILDELPKGPSGKIQRLKLADMIQGQLAILRQGSRTAGPDARR
ncbi:MAG: AMP-binding protein [Chromatiaceae bacterium]|nr:AMP-binding protein [Chromatiaceae bacterium]